MCGIIGYTGHRQALDIVIGGLRRLDYRGYDSAGIALHGEGGLLVSKAPGSVSGLRRQLNGQPTLGLCAIGHTRWATHGAPNEANAHPHLSCSGDIALVHNGVIENAEDLRTLLKRRGHHFRSETDTEVLAHLLEDAEGSTLEDRVFEALEVVEGTYGMAAVWTAEPEKIVLARNGSPLLVGIGEGEFFLASDAAAVLEHTRSIVHLEDGDVSVLTPDGYRIVDRSWQTQNRAVDRIQWSLSDVELNGFDSFMHKEIHEQPESTRRAISGRLQPDAGLVRLGGLGLGVEEIRNIDRILILGCGTSWHAGLIARQAIQELSGIPVSVEYASEFQYASGLDLGRTISIAVSQSGETADTLGAVRTARAAGSYVLGVVNVVGSTLARESDSGVYLRAGPEIGVASTKAFTSQVITLLMLALRFGWARGLPGPEGSRLARELDEIPELIHRALRLEPEMEVLAKELYEARSFLYLGRGASFPVALEGALKLKEISYIHAEGYPAAEMKHGPIALVDEEMPVVCVAPSDPLLPKMVANIQEVRARGGQVLAVGSEGDDILDAVADRVIRVPATSKLFSPLVTVIPLQLLAYHIARLRGCNVDRPRNLAKSVTVE